MAAGVALVLESETDQGDVYSCEVVAELKRPLQDVVDRWIADHGGENVMGACLEYPDQEGAIDLSLTPEQLQCRVEDQPRVLWVVPSEASQEAPPAKVIQEKKRPAETDHEPVLQQPALNAEKGTPKKPKLDAVAGDSKGKRAVAVKKKCALAMDAAVPSGDDAIKFRQPNPKRAGTLSGERYEKYMKATTVNEALALGAAPGDIKHDFKNGLLERRPS